jgi:phosphatidylserine/phosphatidylglycerophosphate/cardiolipin synthase-like enzyme
VRVLLLSAMAAATALSGCLNTGPHVAYDGGILLPDAPSTADGGSGPGSDGFSWAQDLPPAGQDRPVADLAPGQDAVTPGGDVNYPDLPVGPPACNATDPRLTAVQIATLPDDGEAPFVQVLQEAQSSIKVMVYLMGFGGILDTLIVKAMAGVQVKVILDGGQERMVNTKYYDMLTAAGATVEWSDPQFSYMHAKYFVVDDRVAVVSTGNYSGSFIMRERNYVMRVTEPQDVTNLVALFEADFSRAQPDMSCTRVLVSPINSRSRIVDLINSATTSLAIESMQFADDQVRAAVASRAQAGVEVRVLLAGPSWISTNTDAATYLKGQGITPRYRDTPRLHVKSIIVDGVRAYAGSENLSQTSLDHNREVGLILTEADGDAVTTMGQVFDTDWADATAFP